jgi:hypothetical protein
VGSGRARAVIAVGWIVVIGLPVAMRFGATVAAHLTA